MSPAKIQSVVLDDEKKRAAVYMDADQVSLAIGRGGYNINLAGKITGYEIDVYESLYLCKTCFILVLIF